MDEWEPLLCSVIKTEKYLSTWGVKITAFKFKIYEKNHQHGFQHERVLDLTIKDHIITRKRLLHQAWMNRNLVSTLALKLQNITWILENACGH